ncbi:hypothetical protein MRQ36_27395 [Micromonospora sp. R77]|uniref:hypothetical protein n=1 Tax=Micromonospora sp. R77 TaxID=2925836 RepID=UPI001F600EF0|nr:hypothetical protein [Micromonospora sp. R77]MCI4066069.1 hypothetical protein [Micromonospora sp. R77]
MSFDLLVLAVGDTVSPGDVRDMIEHCTGPGHRDGELDPRIVAFYEELRHRFPDQPPYGPEPPWMSMPLDVGIDHVSMSISHSTRGSKAVEAVCRLAERHGLVIYDPQGGEITGLDQDYRKAVRPNGDALGPPVTLVAGLPWAAVTRD